MLVYKAEKLKTKIHPGSHPNGALRMKWRDVMLMGVRQTIRNEQTIDISLGWKGLYLLSSEFSLLHTKLQNKLGNRISSVKKTILTVSGGEL